MKNKLQILLFTILILISCQAKTEKKISGESISQVESRDISGEATSIDFDKHLKVFKYDPTYADSTLVSELWYKGDSIIKGAENFYHRLPFQSIFIGSTILNNAKGQRVYVTFDSLICETGGTSAWNKYHFEYDTKNRPLKVEHYKAWWNEQIDFKRPEKPEYFLGEKLIYEYEDDGSKQFAYTDKGELIEIIEKKTDNKKRLIYEHWEVWNTYRFKVFYDYK